MDLKYRGRTATWLRMRQEWKSHWFFSLCRLASLCWLLWWWKSPTHLPPTGFAVAVLAVLAALMSVHSNLRPYHKATYFILMAALLITEFRAIGKDRYEAQQAQEQLNKQENARLGELLEEERHNTRRLLDQENASLDKVLKGDQTQFKTTISTLLATHSQDEKEFSGVVKNEEALIESQRDLSEQLIGRLVPGISATPHNACLADGVNLADGQILTMIGDNGAVDSMSRTLLKISDTSVIAVHQVENSNAVSLAIDFRDDQNRVMLRLNQDGAVNRSSFILLRPNKSEFLVEDQFGQEFLRVAYLNPKVFRISGNVVYCGQVFTLLNNHIHGVCNNHAGSVDFAYPAPSCPVPKN